MGVVMYYVGMVAVQFAYGFSNILIKISLNRGLDPFVFVVYRHLIAMLLLAPCAFALERRQIPSLSLWIFAKIFVLSSLGTTIHLNLYYAGLSYTSPTVAGALSKVIPSLTFLLALVFRLEKLDIASLRGKAKVIGTLVCMAGSLVFTFWKRGFLLKPIVDKPLINEDNHHQFIVKHHDQHWIKGSALILISFVAWSAWLILQALISKVFPARFSLNTIICFVASLQSSLLALLFGTTPTSWKLQWNFQLFTILYCGVVISAPVYILQTWCISSKGPVFAAMFSPLLLVIIGISSAIAFAEQLHFGSLVGAFVIIIGLYIVLWGKRSDDSVANHRTRLENSDDNKMLQQVPLEDGPSMSQVSTQRT